MSTCRRPGSGRRSQSSTTSSSTTASVGDLADRAVAHDAVRGASTTARRSRVCLARSSWTMPMSALATSTMPKSASWYSPMARTTTSSVPRMALNRVKTLARTMSADGAPVVVGDDVDEAVALPVLDFGRVQPQVRVHVRWDRRRSRRRLGRDVEGRRGVVDPGERTAATGSTWSGRRPVTDITEPTRPRVGVHDEGRQRSRPAQGEVMNSNRSRGARPIAGLGLAVSGVLALGVVAAGPAAADTPGSASVNDARSPSSAPARRSTRAAPRRRCIRRPCRSTSVTTAAPSTASTGARSAGSWCPAQRRRPFRVDQANGAFADEALTVDGGKGDDTLAGGDGRRALHRRHRQRRGRRQPRQRHRTARRGQRHLPLGSGRRQRRRRGRARNFDTLDFNGNRRRDHEPARRRRPGRVPARLRPTSAWTWTASSGST